MNIDEEKNSKKSNIFKYEKEIISRRDFLTILTQRRQEDLLLIKMKVQVNNDILRKENKKTLKTIKNFNKTQLLIIF